MPTLPHGEQITALVHCFEAYLGSIAVFGVLYHRLYLRVPTRFLFAQDIANSQKAYVRDARTRALFQASFARSTLIELLPLVESDAASITGGFYRVATINLADGGLLKLVALTGPPAGGIRGVVFTYRDSDGKEHDFGTIDGEAPPHDMREFDALLRNMISRLERQEDDHRRFLEGLETAASQIWSLFDFLYFSTITQTTVGYGDILPNSTLIRSIVIAQILIGYAVLIVVLNIALLT